MKTKDYLKSKRFWGFVLMAIGKILKLIPDETVQAIGEILFWIGGALAGVGIITAKHNLKFKKKEK